MESELKRAEHGVQDLVQDIKKWKPKTPHAQKIKNAIEISVLVAVLICVLYVVLWVLTHLMPW